MIFMDRWYYWSKMHGGKDHPQSFVSKELALAYENSLDYMNSDYKLKSSVMCIAEDDFDVEYYNEIKNAYIALKDIDARPNIFSKLPTTTQKKILNMVERL